MMKKLVFYALMAFGLVLAGCEKPEPEPVDETKAPVLGEIAGATLDAKGEDITATYEAADFGVSAAISYALFVDKQGANFANKQQVSAKIADGKITLTQNNINSALVKLGAAPGDKVAAEFALYAYLGSTINENALVSNTVKAEYTVFEPVVIDGVPDIDLSQYEVLEDDMSGAEVWGLIGPAVSDWNNDVDMTKISEDPEIWKAADVPFQEDKFKFRGNHEWAQYDLGGGEYAFETPVQMSKGGGDMIMDKAGSYTVFLYPTYGIFYVQEGSGDVPPPPAKPKAWSLIGTIGGTNWDTDLDLENIYDNTWKISNVAIGENEQFKIRADHDWSKSVGGPEANYTLVNEESGEEKGVYEPTIGTKFAAGDVDIIITTAGNYDITFDYGAQTILIEAYQEYPDHLYMIGEAIGGWEWDKDYVIDMVPVINNQWGGDATGQFYTIAWLPAGKGFKFNTKKDWGGDFWGLDTNDGYTEKESNCIVAEDGVYMIHVDFKNKKVHVEPARVYGIGDCFGGWNEKVDANLFKAEGKTLKATATGNGKARAYVESEIATSSWWTREFAILDGKIEYRTGDELAWPDAYEGNIITFDFSNGTGSIEGAVVEVPWCLIGYHSQDFSWSTDFPLSEVEGQQGWLVVKEIGSAGSGSDANITFKFRKQGGWGTQFGAAEDGEKEVGKVFALSGENGNKDIKILGEAVYDIYLNPEQAIAFALPAGSDFDIPDDFDYTPSEDYLSAGNLWKPVDENKAAKFFMYMNIDPNWAVAKYDNIETADCPYAKLKESTYKLTFEDQTYTRWQNQFFIFPQEGNFVGLKADKEYRIKFTMLSTETFNAFFKLEEYDAEAAPKHEGALIWEPEGDATVGNLFLKAGEPLVVDQVISGQKCSNINWIFDFGTNPANTVVYIKDITIIEQ